MQEKARCFGNEKQEEHGSCLLLSWYLRLRTSTEQLHGMSRTVAKADPLIE